MANNNTKSKSSDIRVSDVFSAMWKDKKLFSLVSIFFIFLGYIYGLSFNKNIEFTSSVKVKEPPIEFFSNYKPFFEDSSAEFVHENFFSIFNEKILSSNNLEKFIKQNNEIDEFKAYLLENGITSKKYFQDKLVREIRKFDRKTTYVNKYSLTYPEILDGNKFLNEYIIYAKNIALEEFNKQKQFQLENIILLYEQNFKIALSINLINPLIAKVDKDSTATAFMSVEPESIFYQGTKVLQHRILNLKDLLKKFKKSNDYYPILDNSFTTNTNFVNVSWFPFLGLIIGIFLSFMITIFRVL
jgi:LPS O-antigen subunit length determinant protein (WzzB/FepE family)